MALLSLLLGLLLQSGMTVHPFEGSLHEVSGGTHIRQPAEGSLHEISGGARTRHGQRTPSEGSLHEISGG